VNLQVEIPAGPSYVLDITLPATSISGRVVDAQGATLSGIRVFAYATSKDESKAGGHGIYSTQALTKKDGTFTLTSLSPGTYTLNANADHGWGESDRELGHASAKGVELAEGASVDGIVLRFPVTGSVAGFARTRDGRPVVDAHVIAHSKDGAGPGGYGGGAQTGPDGSFRLAALAIGTYTIYAQAKDNLVSENIEVEVRAGAKSEANLVLEPGNTILVSCVDAAGKSVNTSFDVRDARGRTRQMYYFGDEAEVPVPAGTRRYTHLPDGDYTVSVRRKKGDPVEQRVSLKGGVVRDVRLQLAE
jgi:hypothetical protein